MTEQYRVHAYICDGGSCVKHVTNLGTVIFDKVFEQLPDGCRYVVVSQYSVEKMADRFALIDLWDTLMRKATGRLIAPKPMLVTDSIDVAIMHATLNYGGT